MAEYAKGTTVSSEKSLAEIQSTLRRYGATRFGYATDERQAQVTFSAKERTIRFIIPLPDPNSREFTHHSRGPRTPSARDEAYEAATRQKWRALALVIKAKLEAVESDISTFEQEFYANTVLPNGETVFEYTRAAVAQSIEQNTMLALES